MTIGQEGQVKSTLTLITIFDGFSFCTFQSAPLSVKLLLFYLAGVGNPIWGSIGLLPAQNVLRNNAYTMQ